MKKIGLYMGSFFIAVLFCAGAVAAAAALAGSAMTNAWKAGLRRKRAMRGLV